jgi:predicted  nucleic acid-binding Zn-ribbon protein
MKYIQNTHVAPITVNGRDSKGAVLFTKRFMPEKSEKWTGQVVSTGYTVLTDEEFKILEKTSRTFAVYTGKTGKAELLVVCDDLPPEAKTPHEALVDARKEAQKSAGRIAELDVEIVKLKASLLDAEAKYRQLQSASGSEETLKLLRENNAKLKEALKPLQEEHAALHQAIDDNLGEVARMAKERDAASAEVATLTAAKKGGKEKDFE